jgi:hypothetical protein
MLFLFPLVYSRAVQAHEVGWERVLECFNIFTANIVNRYPKAYEILFPKYQMEAVPHSPYGTPGDT